MKKQNIKATTMAELTKGYEDFIKGKKVNKKGADAFNKALKKSAKPRSAK